MGRQLLFFVFASAILFSCSKEPASIQQSPAVSPVAGGSPKILVGHPQDTTTANYGKKILIDASRDGGVWWFPQSPGQNSVHNYRQGKALSDFLKSKGYQVHELTQRFEITPALLRNYDKVIRVNAFSDYTDSELAAYEEFLTRPVSLLLLSDHMTYTVNDRLSARLGLHFEGIKYGTISLISYHPTTINVNSVPFNAGSFLRNYDPAVVNVIGKLNTGEAVMGEVVHPNARIFFISDVNGIEGVPQPFTINLVDWLFN